MPSPLQRLTASMATRALGTNQNSGNPMGGGRKRIPKAGLGMSLMGYTGQGTPTSGKKGGVIASTRALNYNSPGQPLPLDIGADSIAIQSYQSSVYVMRCVRLIAETLAGLPFITGMDPFMPADYVKDTLLARLLGPSTPDAPGGPNPHITSRGLWAWTAAQYLVLGRFAWENEWLGQPGKSPLVGLWPLVAQALSPIPFDGRAKLWAGFQYDTPTGTIPMSVEKVTYAWRPSIEDWRMPESWLSAAAIPIEIQRQIDVYNRNLFKNNMVAATLVATSEFEESDQRRAWEDQFLAEFSGVDRVGGTIFTYFDELNEGMAAGDVVHVERIATTPMDAQMLEVLREAKSDINIALGVAKSLLGDASQRIYSNSAQEYRNFWAVTMLAFIAELQDHVNLRVAPQVGPEVGWFDLSHVTALQPESPIFAPPDIMEAIQAGVASAQQVAQVLNLPAPGTNGAMDVEIAPVGDESDESGMAGIQGRADQTVRFWTERPEALRNMVAEHHRLPMNTYVYSNPWARKALREKVMPRPHVSVRAVRPGSYDSAQQICDRVEQLRTRARGRKASTEVHRLLSAKFKPEGLDWVRDASWEGPKSVRIEDIELPRGARDSKADRDTIAEMARKLTADPDGAGAAKPPVLVRTPSGRIVPADGGHRLHARKKLGQETVKAYVGTVEDEDGPWDYETMHRFKTNGDTRGWYGMVGEGYPAPAPLAVADAKTILNTDPEGAEEDEDQDYFNGLPSAYEHTLEAHFMGAPTAGVAL